MSKQIVGVSVDQNEMVDVIGMFAYLKRWPHAVPMDRAPYDTLLDFAARVSIHVIPDPAAPAAGLAAPPMYQRMANRFAVGTEIYPGQKPAPAAAPVRERLVCTHAETPRQAPRRSAIRSQGRFSDDDEVRIVDTARNDGFSGQSRRLGNDDGFSGQSRRSGNDEGFSGQPRRSGNDDGFSGQPRRSGNDDGFSGQSRKPAREGGFSDDEGGDDEGDSTPAKKHRAGDQGRSPMGSSARQEKSDYMPADTSAPSRGSDRARVDEFKARRAARLAGGSAGPSAGASADPAAAGGAPGMSAAALAAAMSGFT
jgi:hypothetical protein